MSYRINLIKGESLPHKHENYEIIVYAKGKGILSTVGKNIEVSAGKIAIIPPQTMHGTTTSSALDRIYINGEFHHIFNFTTPVILSNDLENEGTLLAEMIYNNRYARPEYVSALIHAFGHFLLQKLNTEDEISLKIKEIIHDITNRFYDCNINLKEILKNSGYAVDYIRSQFKKITGKTPTHFLTEIRIHHACHLIDIYKKSMPLAVIAEKCGYTDYVYFSRRFKQVMGMAPQKYMD